MKAITLGPSLVEQTYAAMLDDIVDGTVPPNTHLVQEALAARYGVSRQPIQQAMLLLRNDGIVQDAPGRGLIVAPLDVQMMRDRYQVRAVLDNLAARLAAQRCATSPELTARAAIEGGRIMEAGLRAVAAAGSVKAMIAHDVAFHSFIYVTSGNPVIAPTVEVHWRFLRRVMGEVLRRSATPPSIWQQHHEILQAIIAGDADLAASRSEEHVQNAAVRLTATLAAAANDKGKERKYGRRVVDKPDRIQAG